MIFNEKLRKEQTRGIDFRQKPKYSYSKTEEDIQMREANVAIQSIMSSVIFSFLTVILIIVLISRIMS
jgi:hypothetical protein